VIRILDWACAALAVVASSLFLFLTFSICYSIFTRTLGLPSPVWTVQYDEYAMLWITFLGTAWLLARNRHVSIELVVSRFGEKGKRVFGTIHDFLGVILCVTLCYYSALCTWDHFRRGVIDVQGVDVPKAYILAVIPLGFLLLSLQFIRRIVDDFRGTAVKGRAH
jgi:TRAP-type C4-dicarboxylate transport system permease small subunit